MEPNQQGEQKGIVIFLLIALAALLLILVVRVIKLFFIVALVATTFLVTGGLRAPSPIEALLALLTIAIVMKKTSNIQIPTFPSKKLASAVASARSNITSKINLN
jgi:hypothetical protein